ncbi:hypothetical protein PRUPE_7G001800 [Prunus persica]|uniref:Uncharacterized protein n=1 Tax=Prunus persica TaxID=3760 RepID=A0A251N491_PRUPE|nr:hypothetical protein PRUPE_7G001800 [Prunus persica]
MGGEEKPRGACWVWGLKKIEVRGGAFVWEWRVVVMGNGRRRKTRGQAGLGGEKHERGSVGWEWGMVVMGAWGYGRRRKMYGVLGLCNDDYVAMICDHRSKIKRSICNGILKLLDSQLINLNFLFSSKDEDSQLKAIDFGLLDFVKLGWSSKLQVEVRWAVEETTKMSLMTKGYFHNLLDMLLDTTHMCHFNCVYELVIIIDWPR